MWPSTHYEYIVCKHLLQQCFFFFINCRCLPCLNFCKKGFRASGLEHTLLWWLCSHMSSQSFRWVHLGVNCYSTNWNLSHIMCMFHPESQCVMLVQWLVTVHLERFPIGDLLDSQICKKKKKEDDTLEGQQYFTTHPLKIDGKCWEPQFGLTQGCQKGNWKILTPSQIFNKIPLSRVS